jgi:hypothetical protein
MRDESALALPTVIPCTRFYQLAPDNSMAWQIHVWRCGLNRLKPNSKLRPKASARRSGRAAGGGLPREEGGQSLYF